MKEPKILKVSEIKAKLKKLPKGWSYKANKISKEFTFDSISQGIRLLNKIITFGNKIDHHPDVHIYYKKFIFELTRYSVGGRLTDRDFVVAKKIEDLYSKRK